MSGGTRSLVTVTSRSRRFDHGHVTVTVVTGRDRDREARSFFRVCRDSGSSFVNYIFCWRRSDIPNLLFKATRICCGQKKKTKIFNLKWQNLSHHFSIRDWPWPTSSHGHGLLKKNGYGHGRDRNRDSRWSRRTLSASTNQRWNQFVFFFGNRAMSRDNVVFMRVIVVENVNHAEH